MSCFCFRDDVEQLLSHLCKNNQHVESVAVMWCSKSEELNSWEWGLLHAKCLNRLIKRCPKIRSLKLNNIRIYSDKFYDNLGILLPNLTCLHLSHSHFLTPKQIKSIATNCCNLAQLWLSGETCCGFHEDWEDAYCTLFQQRCRTLTHLQFDASRLRDEAFEVLKYIFYIFMWFELICDFLSCFVCTCVVHVLLWCVSYQTFLW